MESSVCLLHRCTPSIPSFRVPSAVNAARTSRPHFSSFRHSSLLAPMGASGRLIGRLFTPVVCAAEGVSPIPPTNSEGDRNIVMRNGMAAAIALACVLGAIGCTYMISHKAARVPKTVVIGSSWLKTIDRPAYKATKLVELMDKGKCNAAREKLKGMFQQNSDEAYHVGLELIKILISRERFRDGITICRHLEDYYTKSTSAPLRMGDLFLYKVLMHGMVGEIGEAETSWNNFKDLRGANSTVITPVQMEISK